MGHRRLCPERGFALSAGGFALVLVAIMALVGVRPKRQRQAEVIDNLLNSGCAVSKLLRTHLHSAGDAEDDEGLSNNTMKNLISKQLHAVDSIRTPYGTLIEDMEIPCEGQPPLRLEYINPFALLYYCSTLSKEFYDFMCQTIPEGGGEISVYADEVSPSDGLKFEQNRQYNCIYWTFLSFPPWFLSRMEIGWLPFAYLPCNVVKEGATNWAKVMRRIMNVFFSTDGWNLETLGVRICNNGLWRVIRASFGCFIADIKALGQICSLKGTNGSIPCPCCKNCLGHCEYFDDAYFVHIHSAEAERFDPHTPETFAESVQMVREAADAVQMGAHPIVLANAEKLHGIVFDAESMAFDEDICKQANLPDSIFFDTMHNVCASGGFAQYEANQFCRRVKEHGFPMELLDSWYACIHSPRQGYAKLSKHWFSRRISDAHDGSHCQAYASEMLTVVSVLSCFADEWLTPQAFMPAEISCLKKLELILDIFSSHNHEHVDLLEEVTISHHKEFVALYPSCVKHKPHYQLHVARAVRRFKRMLTCFAMERKSKFTKEIASHCFKKCAQTICSYELRRLLQAVVDPLAYVGEHLRGKQLDAPAAITSLLPAAWGIGEVKLAKEMVTQKGSFSKGDVVIWFQHGTQLLRAGMILGFLSGEGRHVVHNIASVAMYWHQDGFTWSKVDPPTVLVSASLLLTTVAWHDDNDVTDHVRLLVPRVLR